MYYHKVPSRVEMNSIKSTKADFLKQGNANVCKETPWALIYRLKLRTGGGGRQRVSSLF